ncbi:hypothetical protein DAPPUDRAFT_307638 [Daphnia pulex]|uniref:Uncharacterized protein n=1 Tax=Daphnia pulex TaxID=6669 RepID=E9H3U2_DAPPU|nr:hypothetical protein DAPPUDRAFT_307638 [Daphnia pulex]|eukprot:EFX73654.1 hypothetical protein DAPPUDRAFT_307638 [Daphnia pulex]
MSFKVLSILALVVLVCVLTTTANPAAEGNVTKMAHHKKWERGWKKHVAAERRNTTRTHYHHSSSSSIRKMMEEKNKAEIETVKTKRDTEDQVIHFNYGKWWENLKSAIKEAGSLDPADGEPTVLATIEAVATLEAVDPAAPLIPAEELSTLVDLESVVVEAVDPDSPAEEVELAPAPPPHPGWWWRTG